MNALAKMFFVYGDLSRATVRYANRFLIIQQRIRRCTPKHPCYLPACACCLRGIVGGQREAVEEWIRAASGLRLTKITLKAPVLVSGRDLDSTIFSLLVATKKLLRGKKVWSRSLRGYLAAIRVEVISPREGKKSYRFQLQVRLLVAGTTSQVELASRWKRLLGVAGIPRRARLREIVKITDVTSTTTTKKYPRWLLPSSSTVLGAMPKKPGAASSYVEVLPQLSKVLVLSPVDLGCDHDAA